MGAAPKGNFLLFRTVVIAAVGAMSKPYFYLINNKTTLVEKIQTNNTNLITLLTLIR
jgi:hypothetical protein